MAKSVSSIEFTKALIYLCDKWESKLEFYYYLSFCLQLADGLLTEFKNIYHRSGVCFVGIHPVS